MKKILLISLIIALNSQYAHANKLRESITNVFYKENPIFQEKQHMFMVSASGTMQERTSVGAMDFSYAIPCKLFTNGRMSIEVGGIFGYGHSVNETTNIRQSSALNQVHAGMMYEFVADWNYFYTTLGLGWYYRDVYKENRNGDGIDSRLTAGIKIAVGKSFGDYNLELFYKHYSNGDLTINNQGYNLIGLSAAFKFV